MGKFVESIHVSSGQGISPMTHPQLHCCCWAIVVHVSSGQGIFPDDSSLVALLLLPNYCILIVSRANICIHGMFLFFLIS